EEAAGRFGVAAAPRFAGRVIGEAREQCEVIAKRLERFENAGEVEVGARFGGLPILHHDSVWNVHDGDAARLRGLVRRRRECGTHRVQHRKSDRGAHTLENCSAVEAFAGQNIHSVLLSILAGRRAWKGRLFATPKTNRENRYPLTGSLAVMVLTAGMS